MSARLGIAVGGYVVAAFLLWQLLGVREDIGTIREQCNTDKAMAVAEAERVTREAERDAAKRAIEEAEARAEAEAQATRLARSAAAQANAELAHAQAELERLIEEAADANAPIEKKCLLTRIPADALSVLSQ